MRSTCCWCRQNFYHSKRHLLHGIPTKYCSNTIFSLDFLWFHVVVVVVAGYLDGCSCKTIFYQVLLQALSLNRSTPTTKTISEHCLRLGGGGGRRIMAEVVYVPFLPPMFHIMNIMFTTCYWYHTKNKNDFPLNRNENIDLDDNAIIRLISIYLLCGHFKVPMNGYLCSFLYDIYASFISIRMRYDFQSIILSSDYVDLNGV